MCWVITLKLATYLNAKMILHLFLKIPDAQESTVPILVIKQTYILNKYAQELLLAPLLKPMYSVE